MKFINLFLGFLKAFFSIINYAFYKVQYKVRYEVRYIKYLIFITSDCAECAWLFRLNPRFTFGTILSLIITFSFCSCVETHDSITDKKEAFTRYNAFSDSVANLREISFEDLPKLVCRWKVLEDTLLFFLSKDTLEVHKNVSDIISCAKIGDRIHQTVDRSIDNYRCDFKNLLTIQHKVPTVHLNKKMLHLQHNAEVFFQGLDSVFIPSVNSVSAFHSYKSMLERWREKEFRNREVLMSFLREEDYHYRSFLSHLYDYSPQKPAAIIQETENLFSRISSDADRYSLDLDEVLVYLSIRTSRRQIQNTNVCLSYFSSIQNEFQAAMTMSMLLNPYADFNPLTLGMRTPGQYAQLMNIGGKLPLAINSIQSKQFITISCLDSLPNKLIKEYVAFVMNN